MTKFRKNIIVQLEGWLEVSGVPIWNRSKSWFIWITMLYSDWRVRPYAGCHPKAALEKLDLIVQAAIRRRAKLPECFPNTLLAEKKYGVSKFSKSIPAQRNNLPEDEWLQDSSAQCYSQHSSRKVQGWGLDFLIWAQKSQLPEEGLNTRPWLQKTEQSSNNLLQYGEPTFSSHLCRLAFKGTINMTRLTNDG